MTSSLGGTFHAHRDPRTSNHSQGITRNVTHKTRLFGQSHWINTVTLIQDLSEQVEPHLQQEASEVSAGLSRCKSLAQLIKFCRTPAWPLSSTADIPAKDLSDRLINHYLISTETVYRVLHVPSFRDDYEALWLPQSEPNIAFLIQLKLVLAIGATTYDDQFSLRPSAIHWVCEAQNWLGEPSFKSRLTLRGLQNHILLLLARELVDIRSDLTWISAGALVRVAIYMGMHRDPTHLPLMSVYDAELRRRLWNTILEISLQSSLCSGGPPLISSTDFDTKVPANFDDAQLTAMNPVPRADGEYSQVATAIALRKTFPIRLVITKHLNDLGTNKSYDDTLHLDAQMRTVFRELRQVLQASTTTNMTSPSLFEVYVAEYLMNSYLAALHIPYLSLALRETTYAFSRTVAVETSLNISAAASQPPEESIAARLTTCASGFFHTVAFQASIVVATEMRAKLQEDLGLSLSRRRPDVAQTLNEAKSWALQCIKAGETNVKGYLLIRLIAAQIEALSRREKTSAIPPLLAKAAKDALDTCVPILEEAAGQLQSQRHHESLPEVPSVIPVEIEDWDLMVSSRMTCMHQRLTTSTGIGVLAQHGSCGWYALGR